MIEPRTAGAAGRRPAVTVWDVAVRVFHWALAAAMATAYLAEEGDWLHNNAGYVALALVGFRIAWGFVGSKHARFADFVTSPAAAARYLLTIFKGHPPRYLGHNPAGGAMVLALLVMVTLTAGSGWLMTTDALWGTEWIEDLHEMAANLTLALVAFHVAGVALASIQHRENLVKAMITGRKPVG